jgi:hypothetical protein
MESRIRQKTDCLMPICTHDSQDGGQSKHFAASGAGLEHIRDGYSTVELADGLLQHVQRYVAFLLSGRQ